MSKHKSTHTPSVSQYSGSTFYIKPTYIVSVPNYVRSDERSKLRHSNSLKNLEHNRQNGVISQKAESKIRNAVNWLVMSAKYKRVFDKKTNQNFMFKVNFVTLTIPLQEEIPLDNRIKEKVFHPWITYARKYFGLRNYIWKAETQSNGMLHFHVTTDTFLHHHKLRKSWNRLLEREGLLENFKAKYGHNNPNSTDVHSVKNVKNLAAYLAKYFTKNDTSRRKVTGRLWGCNYELSHEKKCQVDCTPQESSCEHRELFSPIYKSKDIMSKPDYMGRTGTLATIFFIIAQQWKTMERCLVREVFEIRKFEIRNNVALLPPEYFTIN